MKKRIVYVLISGYIFVGLLSIFVKEGFQTTVPRCLSFVIEQQPNTENIQSNGADGVDKNGNVCNSTTADLKTGYHFSHITWYYRSAFYGYDRAVYIPADIVLLAGIAMLIYLSGKKRSKTAKE